MNPRRTIDSDKNTTGKQPGDSHRASPSASPKSSTLDASGSKSPLKVPQGVIVRTPSGKDSQGRKTPPRFFTITNQQLQQMHSSVNTEPIGPKHFKFKDANQTVDGGQECSCTNSPRKTETATRQNPKDTRGCPERIGGMITLKSLLEVEIRRSNVIQIPKVQKGDTQTEREKKVNQLSSPFASPRGKLSSQVDPCTHNQKEIVTTVSCLSGERRGSPHDKYNVTAQTMTTPTPGNKPYTSMPSTSELSGRNIIPNPPKPTDQSNSKCKSGGSSLYSLFEQHLPTPDNKVPKGSLLEMLLSSTEPFDNDRLGIPSLSKDFADRRNAAGTHDPKYVVDRITTDAPNSSLSRGIVAPECTTNKSQELKGINTKEETSDIDRSFPQVAGSSVISSNPKEPTQNFTPVPEIHTEYVPTRLVPTSLVSTLESRDVGASAVLSNKAESIFTLDVSTLLNSSNPQVKPCGTSIKHKAPVASVSSSQTMDKPLLTQSEKVDITNSFKASSAKVETAEVPLTYHVGKVSGNLREETKRVDDKMIAFVHCQKTPTPSQSMGNDSAQGQEQNAKCAPKTTLIINPVMTNSVTASPCSPGPSGQLYGLVRSSNNLTGPVVLVALGSRPQSSNGSTTLTASGNHFNALKPQSCTPVVINNMALTGNLNTDALNVWKSYVRKAYQDKYGTNCDHYMHNQWVSMSVAEKSPFFHQARNRSHPPVVVQTSTHSPQRSTKEVIVSKAPTAKSSSPVIQRQINVIPRLQTTAPDRPIADNSSVSMSEQDVLRELYRSTNMADLSPDFPMATNNSTFRKMTKGSSNFLTDPAASFDPLFAQSLLSGRRYDIDNWIAMKTNWRVTPEWIVDFLADYDERKRARRAAIDAGVMRRVAMVQRMARTQHDDDDDAGSSTSTVQTPQKQSGKRYQQYSDSKENTPTCQEITHQSVSTASSSPTVHGTQHGNNDDKCLTPAKTPTFTRTPTKGFGLVRTNSHDQMTSGCGKQSPHNEYQRSSFDLKPGNLPRVVPPRTPTPSCPRGSPRLSLPTGQDEGLPGELATQNADNNSVSQKGSGYSQDENILGDLDLIDDEELWNIQCSLFPPWQRVPSFIDADAADDFFKDLDKDSVGVSDAPPPASISITGQMEHVGEEETTTKGHQSDVPFVGGATFAGHIYQTEREALPIMSSLIKEIDDSGKNLPTDPSPIAHIRKGEKKKENLPNVKRCLFSGISVKDACQPKDSDPTKNMTPSLTKIPKTTDIHEELKNGEDLDELIESTNTDAAADNGIHSTDRLSRVAEEDAAVSKLLEILDESHQPALSENVEKEEMVMYQDNTLENGRTAEEKISKDVCSEISETAYDMHGMTGVGSSRMADGIAKWHEEIKPIIVMGAELSSSLSLVTDVLEPLPVEKPWNEMMRGDGNNCGSDGHNEHSTQLGTQRDIVNEINHDLLVDAGSPDRDVTVSQISKTKADTADHSREIERWHEEIQPIIALAVNSSSSSSSVENEIRRTHSEDDPRTTPTVEFQVKTECEKTTEPLKDNGKADTEEQPKAIPTAASSSGEYVTADETELYSRSFDDIRTPDPYTTSTAETPPNTSVSDTFNSETAQNSITPDLSSPRVSADSPTTSGNGESGILDEGTDQTISSEEKKTRVSAPRYHGRRRKKRRQDVLLGDTRETDLETCVPVAQSSSETSMTSVASSSSSSSRISTRRKSRGKKRRRKTERHRNKPERKSTDGCSPSESHPSVVASALHPDADKNDSEGDAPPKSCKTKSPRRSLRTKTINSSKDKEDDGDGSSKPHDISRMDMMDHEDDDGSDDDSLDEFVIADQSPTSLKLVMRKSSRLRTRRVSNLPRLRSKRHASVSFQTKTSKMSVLGKVTKTGRRKSRVK